VLIAVLPPGTPTDPPHGPRNGTGDVGPVPDPARGLCPHQAGFQFTEAADWIPSFGIQYKLGVDGLSVLMVVLTTTLSWISILASFGPDQVPVKEYMIPSWSSRSA